MVDFTPHQEDAIRWKQLDACVVAGPGSGKTTVLVERFRRLVTQHRFDPGEILAITFTEKAAANMKAKLAEKFRGDPVPRELESAWVSTIHGFCARLLRENAIAAGIDPRFKMLDAREADDVQYERMNAALDELVAERRDAALELIEALHDPDLAGPLLNAWDAIRSAGMPVSEVRTMASPTRVETPRDIAARLRENVNRWPPKLSAAQQTRRAEILEWLPELESADLGRFDQLCNLLKRQPVNLNSTPTAFKDDIKAIRTDYENLLTHALDLKAAPLRALVFDVLERFEVLYAEWKREAGALDFNDLERRAIGLLQANPAVRDRVRSQFRQVMLDEFQDINEQQAELIALVRAENAFFAVGDVNQAIYGFRNARPEIFVDYRREVTEGGKHLAELMDNFRSREPILRAVEFVLNGAPGIDRRELIAGKEFPAAPQPEIEILRVYDEDLDAAGVREAKWVAQRILEMRRPFRDYAVLCRNGESMKPILEAFDDAGIPYVCGRRQSFLVSREGLDLTALLAMVANPRDSVALATVLRSPLVGLSDEGLARLGVGVSSITAGLNMAAHDPARLGEFGPEDAERLDRFARNLRRWRAETPSTPLDVAISRMLTDCGYRWNPGSRENANVEAFLHLARVKGVGRNLGEFLRELESVERAVNAESDLADDDQGECVQVMTAHAAKGLEFKVVFIASMHKGTQRGTASVSFTPENGLGIRWKDASRNGMKDSWAEANGNRLGEREDHESNRLLYVAMTRAEERLILSWAQAKNKAPNWARTLEERFELKKPLESLGSEGFEGPGFRVAILTTADDPPASMDRPAAWRESVADEIPVLERPRGADQSDSSAAVTSIAAFAACPRKYYLQRYLGWNPAQRGRFDPDEAPAEDGDDISASELGSMVHEVLAGKDGDYPAEARALAEVFTRSELGRRSAAAARSGREWEFIAEIEGTMVRGSVDLWFEEGGEISIVDYKTDDLQAAEAAGRAAEYAPQLALYALAVERAFGTRPCAGYLHFLRLDLVHRVDFDDAAMDRARDSIERLREAQNALRFDLNEGAHCRACRFYKSMCPAA